MTRIDVKPARRRWPNLPGSEDPGSRGKRKERGGFRDWCSRFPSCEGSKFALRAFTLLPPPRKIRDQTCDGRHRRQRRLLPGIRPERNDNGMGKRKTGENQQAGGSVLMSRGGSILKSAEDFRQMVRQGEVTVRCKRFRGTFLEVVGTVVGGVSLAHKPQASTTGAGAFRGRFYVSWRTCTSATTCLLVSSMLPELSIT